MFKSRKNRFYIFNYNWINIRFSIITFLFVDLLILFLNYFTNSFFPFIINIKNDFLLLSILWIIFSYLTERYYDLKKFESRKKYIFLFYFLSKTVLTFFYILLVKSILFIFNIKSIMFEINFFYNLFFIFFVSSLINILISFLNSYKNKESELWIFLGDEEKKKLLQSEIINLNIDIQFINYDLNRNISNEIKNLDGIIIDKSFNGENSYEICSIFANKKDIEIVSLLDWCNKYLEKYPSSLFEKYEMLLESNYFSTINSFSRIKRLGDLILSSFLITVTIPVLLLAAIIIFLQDRGPIFYSQKRTGKNGIEFQIIKLRTMKIDAEIKGVQWSSRKDPRITKFGKFLRLTRIDELPQLLSVFKGEMSLIGPRPERPEIDTKLIKNIPNYFLRYKVLPGLSGWAQVNYPYGASIDDAREKLSYDLYYARNMSVFLDFLIFLRTIRLVFNLKGAIPNDFKNNI